MRALTRVAVALAAGGALAGCTSPIAQIDDGAYRNSVGVGAARLLAADGVRVAGRLSCTVDSPDGWRTVTSVCRGRTTAGAPVRVDGRVRRADSAHPVERYRISVGGRLVATAGRLA